MPLSVNTKGVVKSACCLHSLVVEVMAQMFSVVGMLVDKFSATVQGFRRGKKWKFFHQTYPKKTFGMWIDGWVSTIQPTTTMLMSTEGGRAWQFSFSFRRIPPVGCAVSFYRRRKTRSHLRQNLFFRLRALTFLPSFPSFGYLEALLEEFVVWKPGTVHLNYPGETVAPS